MDFPMGVKWIFNDFSMGKSGFSMVIWRFEQASSLGWDGKYVKQLKQIESTMGQRICEYHPCTSPLLGAVSQQDTCCWYPQSMSTYVYWCGTLWYPPSNNPAGVHKPNASGIIRLKFWKNQGDFTKVTGVFTILNQPQCGYHGDMMGYGVLILSMWNGCVQSLGSCSAMSWFPEIQNILLPWRLSWVTYRFR